MPNPACMSETTEQSGHSTAPQTSTDCQVSVITERRRTIVWCHCWLECWMPPTIKVFRRDTHEPTSHTSYGLCHLYGMSSFNLSTRAIVQRNMWNKD